MRAIDTIIVGVSETAKLIRAKDWTDSLGPVTEWPQSLLTSANIVLQSPVPIVMLWGDNGIMLYNDAYSAFAGKRHPELLGSQVVEGWPEVAEFNSNVMEQCYRRGRVLEYKDQHLTLYRNNVAEDVSMDLTYSPIIDESGKPGGVMAIVLETTQRVLAERKQQEAEAALRAERERLHAVFMQAPASIAILRGSNHVFELANPLYLELVGSKRSLLGKSVRDALPEVIGQGFIEILDNVYQSGEPFYGNEVKIDLDRGDETLETRYLNFVYQPSFDEHGKVDGILVHAVDVTAQVTARQQVQEMASLNATITDNATTGLMIMDEHHHCSYMNPAAEAITGYTLDEIQEANKPLHEIIHHQHKDGSPYPISECPTSKALRGQQLLPSEDYFTRPDGSMYAVSIMSSPLIRDGVTVGLVEEIRDITAQKQAEEEVMQLNRDLEKRVESRTAELTAANKELGRSNSELEDFAYVASHDLQEPLRKIAAFANLLETDYKDQLPEEAHVYLNGLQKSSTRMRTLISDLLTYSRVTTQGRPFESVSLAQMVTEALEDLQTRVEDTGATITFGKLCTVEGDPLQLRLLLQNLISNAMKYSRDGVPPVITIQSKTKNGCCTLSVSDNGIGFDEQYLDRIFTIFQRLHGRGEYEGTGVGLAICKKIVDRHNGSITAVSKPGEGATFIISLPVHGKPASGVTA